MNNVITLSAAELKELLNNDLAVFEAQLYVFEAQLYVLLAA